MNSKILLLSSLRLSLALVIASFIIPATSFGQAYHRKNDDATASTSGPSNRNKPYKTYSDKDNNGNGRNQTDNKYADRKPNDRKDDNRKNDRKASDRGHGNGKRDHEHYRPGTYQAPVNRPYRAPNWHYTNKPRRGEVVRYYPSRAQVIKYGMTPYYFFEGVFYRQHNNQYIVVRPPVGIRIQTIPADYRVFVSHGRRYYYYYGTYYMQHGNYYETVSAPVGSLVDSIPDGYEKLIIDGDTYYIVDGVQYRAVVYDGEIWYEVIKVDC